MKIKSYIWEMRARAAYILFSFICTFCLAYQKTLQLTYIFLLSYRVDDSIEKKFIFTDVYEAFSSIITICIISSLLFILPFITYQILCFFLPTWYIYERQYKCVTIFLVFFSWILYLYIMHFLIIPDLCSFFLKYQIYSTCLVITAEAKILSYLSWATRLLFLASFVFILAWIGIACVISKYINIYEWGKRHKVYIWYSLLFAAILSPPEPWSQFLLAFLFFLICQAIIWICFIHNRLSIYMLSL